MSCRRGAKQHLDVPEGPVVPRERREAYAIVDTEHPWRHADEAGARRLGEALHNELHNREGA